MTKKATREILRGIEVKHAFSCMSLGNRDDGSTEKTMLSWVATYHFASRGREADCTPMGRPRNEVLVDLVFIVSQRG